mgnify:CR=1 FL=1
MTDDKRPFRLMLDGDMAKLLDHLAADLKSQERNYQIGVGTVAARLLESLAEHPELINQLLEEYSRRQGVESVPIEKADPFAVTRKPKPGRLKKAA